MSDNSVGKSKFTYSWNPNDDFNTMPRLNLKLVVPDWGGTSHSEKAFRKGRKANPGCPSSPVGKALEISCKFTGQRSGQVPTPASSSHHMADSWVCQAAIHKTWGKKNQNHCATAEANCFFCRIFSRYLQSWSTIAGSSRLNKAAAMKAAANLNADLPRVDDQNSPKTPTAVAETVKYPPAKPPTQEANPPEDTQQVPPPLQQKGQVRHLGLGLGRMVRVRMVLGMLPIQMNRLLQRRVLLRNLTSTTSGT